MWGGSPEAVSKLALSQALKARGSKARGVSPGKRQEGSKP
jgi:hypothetical protein